MSKTHQFEDISPMLAVQNVVASVDFYVERLGFEESMISDDEQFAIIVHSNLAILLRQALADQQIPKSELYVWVENADEVFAALKDRLALLAPDCLKPPFDLPYGMREFHVTDPDGHALYFGSEIEASDSGA